MKEHKEEAESETEANEPKKEHRLQAINESLKESPLDGLPADPVHPVNVLEAAKAVLQGQQEESEAVKTETVEMKRERHATEERIASLRANVSLEEWKTLDPELQQALLDTDRIVRSTSFNVQKNAEIEWAQFSWNPVTGCKHTCPYCYARDLANSSRMEKFYPHGFEPAFRPNALLAPNRTKVPREAERDTRFKNVFACSMADLFGGWVPKEWIEAVFRSVRENPQWNFLFLTKFPQRLAEFNIPENAWMGTTVDLQVRVKNSEETFSKVKCGVKWLSVEPMLEPLEFKNLKVFDWIVVGGASKSNQTPEWYPPFEWIADLAFQAREAGTKIYFKTSLGVKNRLLELPFDAPIEKDPQKAPEIFSYLKREEVG